MYCEEEKDLASILLNHDYELKDLIGQGGYGKCYIVYSRKYKQDFACKVFNGTKIPPERVIAIRNSYTYEINALKQAYHPHIVKIYDCFDENCYFFIIEEYCVGGSLDKLIGKEESMKCDQFIKYISSISDALCYLHELNMVHHDIKPANIFIDEYGRAKLGDFGLASTYQTNRDLCNKFVGSIAYSPPEVLQLKPYDPFKADVWSFGVLLYQLFTGNLPFMAADKKLLKEAILCGNFAVPKKIDNTVTKIILSCLRQDPTARPTFREISSLLPHYKVPRMSSFRSHLRGSISPCRSTPHVRRYSNPMRNVGSYDSASNLPPLIIRK